MLDQPVLGISFRAAAGQSRAARYHGPAAGRLPDAPSPPARIRRRTPLDFSGREIPARARYRGSLFHWPGVWVRSERPDPGSLHPARHGLPLSALRVPMDSPGPAQALPGVPPPALQPSAGRSGFLQFPLVERHGAFLRPRPRLPRTSPSCPPAGSAPSAGSASTPRGSASSLRHAPHRREWSDIPLARTKFARQSRLVIRALDWTFKPCRLPRKDRGCLKLPRFAALPLLLTALAASAQNPAAQRYAWKNVQIVGGGFVDGIVFHPTAADVRYARTDIGGAYRWDNAAHRWQPILDWIS